MNEHYEYTNSFTSRIVKIFQPRDFENFVAFNIQFFSWDYKKTTNLVLPNSCMLHNLKALTKVLFLAHVSSLMSKKYRQLGWHIKHQIIGLRNQEINHRFPFKWILYLYLLVNFHKFPIILVLQVIRHAFVPFSIW